MTNKTEKSEEKNTQKIPILLQMQKNQQKNKPNFYNLVFTSLNSDYESIIFFIILNIKSY